MPKPNKDKTKNPVLEEIENDNTPIDDKGNPVVLPEVPKLEDLLAKNPDQLTAEDLDILSQNADDLTDEQKVAVGLMDPENIDDEKGDDEAVTPISPVSVVPPVVNEEAEEEKERRYRAQQTEAQIQAEKNKALVEKAEQATKVGDPTIEELKAFVAQDGASWDELTTFEQAMAKRTYLSEKKSSLVLEAIESGRKVDEWAGKVDEFLDMTDSKPEYVALSSHEADFRKYAMKESHRGVDMQMLLNSFLYTLPKTPKTTGSLFNRGGGGERTVHKDGVVDAEQAKNLREKDPKEYKRQVQAGKIKVEI